VIRSVCVFCGSSAGDDSAFAAAARALGGAIARSGRKLVYGGGRVGLMGILADEAMAGGASVVGVIPGALARKEVAHPSLSELRVVGSMHERKATMAELADAFVALPGGLGTLEELFEVWTWGQLGLHSKPVGILTVADFFAPLLTFLDSLVARGFVRPQHRDMLVLDDDAERLLARLNQARGHMAPTPKWIAPGQE
jgi:uncharacterized protein (TIGR00730 family)